MKYGCSPKAAWRVFLSDAVSLTADISLLNVQDECIRVLVCCFFFLCTDSVLKERKIIFILEALKAVNLKCFSLHETTKKVLKGNYRTAYLFGTIKICNIAVLSLKQYLSICRRCGPEVLPQLTYCKLNNNVAILDCGQRTSEYIYFEIGLSSAHKQVFSSSDVPNLVLFSTSA